MDVREVYFAVSLFVFLINFCSRRFIVISKKILSKNVLCSIWQTNSVFSHVSTNKYECWGNKSMDMFIK